MTDEPEKPTPEEVKRHVEALLERTSPPTDRPVPPLIARRSVTDFIDLDCMVGRMSDWVCVLKDGKLHMTDPIQKAEQHFHEEDALHVGTDGTLQVSTKYIPLTGFAWGVVNLVRDGMGLPEFERALTPEPPDPPIPEPEPTSCTKDWRCSYDPDHEGACSWRGIDFSKLEVPKEGPAVSAELCGDPHVVGPREGCHVVTNLCESCGKDEAGIRVILGDPPEGHECSDRCDRGEFVAHCQQLQGHEDDHSAMVSTLSSALVGDREAHEVSWS